ncbi:uncharacterized protein LOC141661465 isoform X1 [Apium graveolens]|uniref:uncharacterized protein LOC141661465 isoform X1 n=1 Tax=Apium graveolens TaxID=4045 RepID=UPI003D78DDCD
MHRMLRGAFQRSAKLQQLLLQIHTSLSGKYQKPRPCAICDRNMQIFMYECAEEDEDLDVLRLGIQAKLRGMSVPEFLDYARKEKQYCKEMCAKCKDVPLPPGCEWNQETVDKYCGRWMVL